MRGGSSLSPRIVLCVRIVCTCVIAESLFAAPQTELDDPRNQRTCVSQLNTNEHNWRYREHVRQAEFTSVCMPRKTRTPWNAKSASAPADLDG